MKANILIVDDRRDKQLVMQAILEDLRQNVHMASSGEDALRQVLRNDYAVILLDVNMPGLDGLETAALIRSRKKSAHTPIIFITADYNDEVHTARGYSLGAVDYITSPVVPEVLRAKVNVFVQLYLLAEQAKLQAREHVALAEERAARTAAEQATRRLAFLAHASATLSGSLDLDATMRELGRLVVPAFADVAALTLLAGPGLDARTEITWHSAGREGELDFATVAALPDPLLVDIVERVAATRKSEILGRAVAASQPTGAGIPLVGAVPVDSLLCVALCARGRTLGVLSLGLGSSHRSFDADALPVATDLASRAAIALDNALLYRNIQDEDRRKNEFLAMLAHELRNPLAPISNAVHVMQVCEGESVKIGWAREVIGRQVKQLVRLVDDLLDVSRITRGKIELKIQTVDVGEVLAAAVETSRPNVDAQGHTLTVMLPPEPVALKGDFARVAQALANLINNAAKYTERGGRIAVNVRQEGHEIVFQVRDSGMGIPPEHLATIFEPFTQIERSLDRSQGGLGIGLTLVRRLVEMQGGSVAAHSAGKDQGSEFTIRLPAANPGGSSVEPAQRADAASRNTAGGLRVLVVDDNHDVAESTAMVLRMAGCEVHLAHDGASALAAMPRLRPDAVLLDIGLPGMDGYEVTSRIRSDPSHRRTLIVAVSGYGQDEYRLRSSQAGFDYHVVKPISPATLTGLLGSLRGHRAPASAENVVSFPARRTADGIS